MRTTIIVERERSYPASHVVADDVVSLLEDIVGISNIVIESKSPLRAKVSYHWKDPGIITPGLSGALVAQGMRLVDLARC